MKIGLLVSGGLGLRLLEHLTSKYALAFVLTDRQSADIIATCEENAIPCFAGNPRQGRAAAFLAGNRVDLLLSINYLFIIEPDIIELADKAINIHGSLLPRYRGRTPHVWAIINNEKETGATAHLISKGCDEGDIVLQERFDITEEMTGADVLNRFNILYPAMTDAVIEQYTKGTLQYISQDESKATYYGKRTPADGKIQFHWQRERIRNWVRAQASPYPGAFAFFKGRKLVIHYAEPSEMGFHFEIPDGSVLAADEEHLVVKTPNGAITFKNFVLENENASLPEVGDILE